MPMTDDSMGWNRKRKFFPVRTMSGVLDDNTSGVPKSLGAGTMDFTEISAAFEQMGMRIGADADEIYHFWPISWDFDRGEPLRFRVWFVHSSTDADAPIFSVAYKGIGKQDAFSDAKSSPDETVTFDAHICSTTDNSLEVTAWNESASDLYIVATDFAILLALTVDTMAASANEQFILGLEVDYRCGAAPNLSGRQTTRSAVASPTGPNG
jgi:hypothetical protein